MKKNKIIIFSLTSFIILSSIVVIFNSMKKNNSKILTTNHEQQKIDNTSALAEKQITSIKSSSKGNNQKPKDDFDIITIKQNDSKFEAKLNTKSKNINYKEINNMDDYINLSQSEVKIKFGDPLIIVTNTNTEEQNNDTLVYKLDGDSTDSLLLCYFNNDKLESTEYFLTDGVIDMDSLSAYIAQSCK